MDMEMEEKVLEMGETFERWWEWFGQDEEIEAGEKMDNRCNIVHKLDSFPNE